MTAKEYLNQIEEVRTLVKSECERLANMKEMAMSLGTKELKQDMVQTSVKNAGLEESVGSYVDYEQKMQKQIERYIELEDRIVSEIYSLNCSVKIKQILCFKYIHCLTIRDIANQMGYSQDWVKHLHGQGLGVFESQYKEKLNDSL